MPKSREKREHTLHDVPLDQPESAAAATATAERPLWELAGYYNAHYKQLVGYAFAQVGNAQQAEDIVQQAFANTYDAVGRGTRIINLSAWLHRCIRNLANEQRRHDPFLALNEDLNIGSLVSTSDQAALRESCDAVQRAVDVLPEHMRAAFILSTVRGFTYKEVASALDRSVESVRQMISRARRHVREMAGPAELPAILPVIGWPLSRLRPGALLSAARHWAVTHWHDLQNNFAAFVSRLVEPLSAPVTSLVIAAVAAGGVISNSPVIGQEAGVSVGAQTTLASAPQGRAVDVAKQRRPVRGVDHSQPTGDPSEAPGPVQRAPKSSGDRQRSDIATGSAVGAASTEKAKTPPQVPVGPEDPGQSGGGLVTRGYDGSPANNSSGQPSVSSGGESVAFASAANNIMPGDTNGATDVFAVDTGSQRTTTVSVGADGGPAGGPSADPAIAANGVLIAFSSVADDLVAGDNNGFSDIFVRNTQAGTTKLVSEGVDDQPANGPSNRPAISDTGRFVAFASMATNLVKDVPPRNGGAGGQQSNDPAGATGAKTGDSAASDVVNIYVRDAQSGVTELVSKSPTGEPANGGSYSPSLSADGHFIAFVSAASNLVANDQNGMADIFVFDLQTKTIARISQTVAGGDANGPSNEPKISADGRFVTFSSLASNMSAGDADGSSDIYLYDRTQHRTALASGVPGPRQNADPRCAQSTTGIVRAVLGDSRVDSVSPTVGGHGRLIAFQAPIPAAAAAAIGISPSESQIFWHDMATNTTCLAIQDIANGQFRAPTRDAALDATENALVFVGERDIGTPDKSLKYTGVFFQSLGQ